MIPENTVNTTNKSEFARLYFINARSKGNFASYEISLPAKLERLLKKYDFSQFVEKDEYVAVKTHFGSFGAHRIIRPIFLKKIVEAVKEAGGKPFVTDTTRIDGIEYLEAASQNGINAATLGCPVVLADGLFGQNSILVEAGEMGKIGIAAEILDARSMIVVSHSKGHIAAGYGGAVKNLAMGCVSSNIRGEGKNRARIHAMENERVSWFKERCIMCGECVKSCDHNAIIEENGRIKIMHEKCQKCGRCTRICPEQALELDSCAKRFHIGMADAAKAVTDTFEKNKIHYLNFIMEVMPHCDCHQHSDVPIINDQGILMGKDPLAIDLASMDIIENSQLAPDSASQDQRAGKGLFERITGRNAKHYLDRCLEGNLGSNSWNIEELD